MKKNLAICDICQKSGVSKIPNCSLKSKCRYRSVLNLSKENFLVQRKWFKTQSFISFILEVRKSWTAEQASRELQIPIGRLQRFLNEVGGRSWPIQNSKNIACKFGRLAEVWVKSQPEFKCLRDSYLARGPHEDFDLILQEYGSVDVKHTALVHRKLKGYAVEQAFWSFNTKKVSKSTKYIFLVACDETKTNVLALFILSKSDLWGRTTVQIPANPIRGYYRQFLFKEYKEGENGFKLIVGSEIPT